MTRTTLPTRSGGLRALWLIGLIIGPFAALAARAQDVVVAVPAGCGSQAELQVALRQLLGANASAVRGELRIDGPSPSGLYSLHLRSDDTARDLQNADCRTLFRSACVMLASAEHELPRPDRAAIEDTSTRLEPDAVLQGSAAIGGGAVLGLLPGLAFQLELQGQLQLQRFGMAVALLYLPTSQANASGPFGAELSALGGRAAGTFVLTRFARLSSGIALHHFVADGRGNASTRTATAWSAAAVLELALRLPSASPLICELALAADWAWLRPSFEFAHGPRIFRVGAVGGMLLARLGWNFD